MCHYHVTYRKCGHIDNSSSWALRECKNHGSKYDCDRNMQSESRNNRDAGNCDCFEEKRELRKKLVAESWDKRVEEIKEGIVADLVDFAMNNPSSANAKLVGRIWKSMTGEDLAAKPIQS